ncbi:MAG: hypothetical protein EHM58_17620 [Ignavibacteriae bacterium]|nr:MAG: hypothetical protein EHM58_17620 [Ignavibacteriota bacterium]
MKNYKAIDILKSLNKEEFKRLGKYLSSPFFTTNKNLMKLYRLLKPYYPGFSHAKLSKQRVYKNIYGNSVYHDERFRKLFSEFYKELNKYLVILGLENNEMAYNRILLDRLNFKKLDSLFLKKFSEANEFIDKLDFHFDNYLEKFLLQWEYVVFYLNRGEQHKIAPNILKRGNYIIFYFLFDIILTIKDIDTNRKKFGYNPEPNLPEAFLENFNIENFFDYLDKYDIKDKEIINLYYTAFLAFRNFDEEKYYYNFHELVLLNWDKLSKIGRFVVISYLVNYCNNKIHSGKSEFEIKLYEVYKLFLEYGLYRMNDDNYIRFDILLHISDNFSKMGKNSEVKKFLDDNIIFIDPEQRNNILNYCNALVDFENKKYGESLNDIAHIKTNAFLFKHRIKKLLMKIYFEMNLYDDAISASNNYRNYLLHNKLISDIDKDMGIKFLNNYNDLLKIRFLDKKNSYSMKNLENSINECNSDEIYWIKEKLQELKNEKYKHTGVENPVFYLS